MAAEQTTYWIRRTSSSLIELRQTRYREQFQAGRERPHDVCALSRDVEQCKDMVRRYQLGTVDWTLTD